ncbi:glycine--tRNA ligase [Candidatus Pyrohabitans sp.]
MSESGDIMEIALRRGFINPSYEIYGGVSGFYDYAPLGAALKKNLEDIWRRYFVVEEGFMEISSPTISPEDVFIASGHVNNFVDPLVSCQKCGSAFRADHLIAAAIDVKTDGLSYRELDRLIQEHKLRCPDCGGELSEVYSYNLMFKTYIGPGSRKVGYLRPETAQGMFILFPRLYSFYRKKLPFGVAQIGKAYRNEISPRQGLIRLREFTQAEVEIFIDPSDKSHSNFARYADEKLRLLPQDSEDVVELSAREAVERGIVKHEFLCYYLVHTQRFLLDIGIPYEKLRFRQHLREEMAHYAADCWDAEVRTQRFGWIEVVGIADRTDYDLRAHEKQSGVELRAFRQFPEPVRRKRLVLEPKMAKLGPEFKSLAAKIAQALKELSQDEVKRFAEQGNLVLRVEGEEVTLTQEHAEVKEVEETITGEKFLPHVIEPSFGIDRIFYCVLENAFYRREDKNVLRLNPRLAPVKAAVFPLLNREELVEVARDVFNDVKRGGILALFDASDSIGRRYARVDEIGVPFAVTIDFDTLEDETVTIRERDSAEQVRVHRGRVAELLADLIEGKRRFGEL